MFLAASLISVRAERGRGRGGRGRGPGRFGSGSSDGQFGTGRMNGYQKNFGGESDGNFVEDGFRGRGRGPRGRGRGRGRGFNEDRGYGNENQAYAGSDNQGHGGGDWEESAENSGIGYGGENRYFRNENGQFGNENQTSGSEGRGYGGENRGYRGGKGRQYGGREGRGYGREESRNDFEKKEDAPDGKEQTENADTWNGRYAFSKAYAHSLMFIFYYYYFIISKIILPKKRLMFIHCFHFSLLIATQTHSTSSHPSLLLGLCENNNINNGDNADDMIGVVKFYVS